MAWIETLSVLLLLCEGKPPINAAFKFSELLAWTISQLYVLWDTLTLMGNYSIVYHVRFCLLNLYARKALSWKHLFHLHFMPRNKDIFKLLDIGIITEGVRQSWDPLVEILIMNWHCPHVNLDLKLQLITLQMNNTLDGFIDNLL